MSKEADFIKSYGAKLSSNDYTSIDELNDYVEIKNGRANIASRTLAHKIKNVVSMYRQGYSSNAENKMAFLDMLLSAASLYLWEVIKPLIRKNEENIYEQLPSLIKELEDFLANNASVSSRDLFRYEGTKQRLAIERFRNANHHRQGAIYYPRGHYSFEDMDSKGRDKVSFTLSYNMCEIILDKTISVLVVIAGEDCVIADGSGKTFAGINNANFEENLWISIFDKHLDEKWEYVFIDNRKIARVDVASELSKNRELFEWSKSFRLLEDNV
jgi:hypothetical protein